MGEGVNRAAGQHMLWRAAQQIRVENGNLRDKVRMTQRGFHLDVGFIGHHRILRHFAAGTGRGRDGDQRQGCASDRRITDFFQIAQGIQWMLAQRRKGLRGIQHAAAANGHHALHLAAPATHPAIYLRRRGLMADNLMAQQQGFQFGFQRIPRGTLQK